LSQSSDKAVGDAIAAANARWDFAGDVAKGFDSHIERSVPGYREVHELIASMSDFFVRDGSLVYELGCSTGTLTAMLGERHSDRDVTVVGVDREPEMVTVAQQRTEHLPTKASVMPRSLPRAAVSKVCLNLSRLRAIWI